MGLTVLGGRLRLSLIACSLGLAICNQQVFAADTIPPTSPTSLTASVVGSSGFTVSWGASTDNVGVSAYELWLGNTVVKLAPTVTSYTYTALAAASKYSVAVRARDAAGNYSPLTTLVVQTTGAVDTQAPTTPGLPVISALNNTGFTASWTASSDNVGVSAYQLWWGNTAITVAGTVNSYTFSGLTAASHANFSIRARDAAGNWSALTTPIAVTLGNPDTQAPTAPTALSFSNVTATGFTLSWNASTDNVGVTGYQVWLGNTAYSVPIGQTSLTLSGLAALPTGNVGVRARDAAGNWSAMALGKVSFTQDIQPPTVPSGLTVSALTSTGFTLNWTASTDNVGVTGYEVALNGANAQTVTGTSQSFTSLTANTAYTVTVRARDAAGNWSALATQTATTAPLANQVVVYYYNSSNWTTVNIHYGLSGTWTTPPGVAMTLACPGYWTKTIALGSSTSAAVDFNNGTTWDNNGGSNYTLNSGTSIVKSGVVTSNAVSPCTPDTVAPTVPAGLTTSGVTATGVVLSWTASTDTGGSGLAGYRIYSNGSQIATSTTASYTVTGLTAATGYSFTVAAYDGAGNVSAQSSAVSVTTTAPDTTPPSTPTGLSAGTVTSNSVPLTWQAATDNVGVTSYDIYRNGTVIGNSTTTSYTDNSVAGSTTYSYTVTAKDAAGNVSTASAAASVTTPVQTTGGTPLGGDPREDAIYFVMTARFYDGDPSNNEGGIDNVSSGNAANNDPMFRGDFKGLISKLDYIKALGFSAIWITPVVLNRNDYDYHGYHGYDFYMVDPRLESPGATYQDLINAAHAKGIKIIQDVVYNHSTRWGARGLWTGKFFGVQDSQWGSYYDTFNPNFTYNGLTPEPISGKPYYNGDMWANTQPSDNTCKNWGVVTSTNSSGQKIYGCQWPDPTNGEFPTQYYHQCWLGNWEDETAKECWIAGDLADFNTESTPVQNYLIGAYNKFIDMGVDGFRIDTAIHIHRVMWNRHFLPAAHQHAIDVFGAKGQNFYTFGEVAAFVNDKWNHNLPDFSVQFYTWKERTTYSADDATAIHDQFNYEEAQGTANQPTSTNAFLNGNLYHTPDHSQASGLNVIDMRMHMNFSDAHNAFANGKDSDDANNDATYNVVYVDSHDYGPNKSSTAYSGGTDAWAENMDLMWTFRGIPTIFQGSEIEFQAGKTIDCGPSCPLATTRRAYFGANLDGSVTASDFGVVGSSSGTVATTLNYPLVKHVQRLNMIRRKIPALQKGQYATDGITGNDLAYRRRFTDATTGVDSFVLVTISAGATFTGIPNGTYTDAVTGDVQTVSNGTLTAVVSGKGNMKVYVLSLPGNPAPGKIGVDGPYLKP